MNTKIKICGLTTTEDALELNRHHVEYAGMVMFFPKSKRNIEPAQAELIINTLASDIKKVAVVVSPDTEQVKTIESLGFDYIQIHGSLTDDVKNKTSLPILKAFNVSDMASYESYHNDPKIAGYVFDAIEPGSGKVFDWNLVKDIPKDEKLLFLAGGLSAENVDKAIAHVQPDIVDVSSGVEYNDKPGKDPNKIAAFVQCVRCTINF